MGRAQRPGDWAAWMGTPAPATRPGAPAPVGEPVPASDPAPPAEPGPHLEPAPPAEAGPHRDPAPPAEADADHDGESAGGERGRSVRREATRQRVLDAAREVFAERGVIGGTVEDICEQAGFTRGAFYSNFADKDDVLQALVEREHAKLLAHLDASLALVDQELAEAPDLATAVASIVDRILRSVPVDRQLSLVQTELEIHAVRRPDLARTFLETDERFRSRIVTFLEAALARNGLELTVDPADAVDASVAVVERSVRRALLAGGDADPDAMARAVLPAMLLALSRPVGA
jgi:AcrR family transcriptional regulator